MQWEGGAEEEPFSRIATGYSAVEYSSTVPVQLAGSPPSLTCSKLYFFLALHFIFDIQQEAKSLSSGLTSHSYSFK